MRIIQVGSNKYIDQQLFDFVNTIWLSFNIQIPKDSNIYFAKNTTVNRLITDYSDRKIHRVIKKEKADHVIIDRFTLSNYPQYYDGVNITEDDTKEPVYGIYNNSLEIQDTIELILHFFNTGQNVKYVNQDRLNESINNGFVIDSESYITLQDLIQSRNPDNEKLAISMLVQSDLKSNIDWILYLFHKKADVFRHDGKRIILNYIDSLATGYSIGDLLTKLDVVLKVVKDQAVIDRFLYRLKQSFMDNISKYFESLGTSSFKLNDFKIEYNG